MLSWPIRLLGWNYLYNWSLFNDHYENLMTVTHYSVLPPYTGKKGSAKLVPATVKLLHFLMNFFRLYHLHSISKLGKLKRSGLVAAQTLLHIAPWWCFSSSSAGFHVIFTQPWFQKSLDTVENMNKNRDHLVMGSHQLHQTTSIFNPSLCFSLIHTDVKFCDCISHSCDSITLKRSDTCRLAVLKLAWWPLTHKQTHTVKTL